MISFDDYLELNESQKPFIRDLVSRFGDNLVFGELDFSFDETSLIVVYDIVNKHLFDSKLDNCQLKFIPYHAIEEEYYSRKPSEPLPNKIFGMHLIDELHKDLRVVSHPKDYRFGNEIIMINQTRLPKSSFGTAIAVLCHEMIHKYDTFFGDYRNFLFRRVITGQKFDPHKTKTFKTMMNKAIELGIDVRQTLSDLETIEDLDASAIEKLRQLRESEWYNEKLAKDKKTTYLGNGITVIPGSHTTIANW